jgi:hypothetical protein
VLRRPTPPEQDFRQDEVAIDSSQEARVNHYSLGQNVQPSLGTTAGCSKGWLPFAPGQRQRGGYCPLVFYTRGKNSMSPAVQDALRELAQEVNKKTGITNSFDYNHCIDMFARLVASHETFDPEEIRAWLCENGEFLAEDAAQVKSMAEKFASGAVVKRR